MRLIDADAFKKILTEHEMNHDKRRSFDDYDCGAANAYEHASDLLDEMPTVERPHGEWEQITAKDGEYYCYHKCTNCGQTIESGFDNPPLFNFCPQCGALMRKGGKAE